MFLFAVLEKALVITVFVAVMMLVVEYVNVWSRGAMSRLLQGSRLRQYVLAAALGASPGCLGAFVLVTLHVQRRVSLGALTAGMIATSGDEMFVMLATVPGTAVAITGGLVVLGLLAGWLTDLVVGHYSSVDHDECCEFVTEHDDGCHCFAPNGVKALWMPPNPERAVATLALIMFVLAVALGWIGEAGWNWERVAFLVVGLVGALIAATASDEFFKEHLWTHVVRHHVPRLMAWTAGALLIVAMLDHFVDLEGVVEQNRWVILVAAGFIGLIPESGPHLIFVTLFANGTLPLSVLVTSSAVQDGHGMLPLLAHSRRDFFLVKGVNLLFGLAVGAIMMAIGY